MACLDNYITVYGHCDGVTPISGLYINKNLAGISLKRAANYAEGELQTGVELLNQAITNGIQRTRSELITEMLGYVRFNSIVSSSRYGKFTYDFTDATKYFAASAANRGIKAELKNCCRLTSLYVKRVAVLTNTNITDGTLTITDGGTVTTKTFSSTAQVLTEVEVNYKANSTTILITLDNTSISVSDSSLNYTGSCGFCSNDCCSHHNCNCNEGVNVWGWNGTSTTGTTYGLSALIDVICDEDKFICEISHIPDVAWMSLYAAGVWAFEYGLLSNRINVFTNYGDEQISAQIEQWNQEFNMRKTKVAKQLPRYLSQIDMCCLECNSSRWETSIP